MALYFHDSSALLRPFFKRDTSLSHITKSFFVIVSPFLQLTITTGGLQICWFPIDVVSDEHERRKEKMKYVAPSSISEITAPIHIWGDVVIRNLTRQSHHIMLQQNIQKNLFSKLFVFLHKTFVRTLNWVWSIDTNGRFAALHNVNIQLQNFKQSLAF